MRTADPLFSNAVVKAGRGRVTRKRHNPFEEGEALAEYLRSSQPLGEDERELLAQLVTGVEITAVNTLFFNAVAKAERGLVAHKQHNPSEEGKALAKYLRSDQPIGEDERELLAQLVTGEWRMLPHRQSFGAGASKIRMVVDHYRQLVADGTQKDLAKYETADKFELNYETVKKYLKMTSDREAALRRHGGQT